jgi:competence protein ComFC
VRETLDQFGAGILDLVYPPKCLTCGAMAEPFCAACAAAIAPAEDLVPPGAILDIRSAGYHEGPLREAVLRLKFGRKLALVTPLAELLGDSVDREWRPDALVPVPDHWTRRLGRGYNQAELLARQLGRLLETPVEIALRRVRHTGQQIGHGAVERSQRLRGAFDLHPKASVSGRRVLLVDDVWTTGATLGECSTVLQQAGASAVYAVTVTHDR